MQAQVYLAPDGLTVAGASRGVKRAVTDFQTSARVPEGAQQMPSGLETRRRRALYRAAHRGTKEMDLVLGRFVAARIARMDEAEIGELERLLAMPDPDLNALLMDPQLTGTIVHRELIEAIREFHGLGNGRKETA